MNSLKMEDVADRFYTPVSKYAHALLPDSNAADDVTQECFVRFQDKIDTLQRDDDGTIRAYLFKTTRNLIVDNYRSGCRTVDIGCDVADSEEQGEHHPGLTAQELTPSEYLEKCDGQDALRLHISTAMEQLSRDHQQVIVLFHFYELEVTDIAARAGLPEGTVKSRLCRARDMLKRILMETPEWLDHQAAR